MVLDKLPNEISSNQNHFLRSRLQIYNEYALELTPNSMSINEPNVRDYVVCRAARIAVYQGHPLLANRNCASGGTLFTLIARQQNNRGIGNNRRRCDHTTVVDRLLRYNQELMTGGISLPRTCYG